MKATMLLCAAAVVAAACTHGGRPETRARDQARTAEDEAKLAAELSGMVAGPAEDCVLERDLGGNQAYGGRVILFRGPTDDVVYVNRLPGRCPGLDSGMAIKVRTPAARLCRGDVVSVFDPVSRTAFGGCSLGEFTPYRRSVPPKIE